MPSVVLMRRGRAGAVVREALLQEGIAFLEIGEEDLASLGRGAHPGARVLILPAPLDRAALPHLAAWRASGGATLLLGKDWPAELLSELAGVRELPHAVSGGHLWASSPELSLPATAPDRPLQITGERRLYEVETADTRVLALASANPSAAVSLDADRDGLVDEEWYFCGPSISRISRGQPSVEKLSIPGLGAFAPTAATAGDFTGDGVADDLLVASDTTFAVLRGGAWGEPQRTNMPVRHAMSHPGPGPIWTIVLFLGDGSSFVTSLDGGKTFGPPQLFAPAGTPIASDFSYSFDFVDTAGARRTGFHVWSGDEYFVNLGSGFGPAPLVADLGPRYLDGNIVRPDLGLCSDPERRGLRDRLTLVVGNNLYRRDPATGTFDYPRALHDETEVARSPLVVRRDRTVAFLFDFEGTVRELQQGRPEKVSPRIHKSGVVPPESPELLATIPSVISAFDDWVDYTAWDLPQADLHERLLRQAIAGLLDAPLPRLWYWPGGVRSVASLSHDVETSLLGQPDMVRASTLDIARGSTAAGRRDTFFVLDTPDQNFLTKEDIAELLRLGHHVTLHFNTFGGTDFTAASLKSQAETLRDLGVSKITGNRSHALAWLSDLLPRALAAEPEIFFDSTFGGGPGFSHSGSVLPYRVLDEDGEPFASFEEVPCALMDVADAKLYFSGLASPGLPTMTIDQLFERARNLALRNDDAFYGVLDASFHPAVVSGLVPPIPAFLPALAEHAKFLSKQGIASMTLAEIAAWWRARRGIRIVDIRSSDDGSLTFALEADEPVPWPTVVIPAEHGGRPLAKITANGAAIGWTPQVIDGAKAAFVVLAEARGRTELAARFGP